MGPPPKLGTKSCLNEKSRSKNFIDLFCRLPFKNVSQVYICSRVLVIEKYILDRINNTIKKYFDQSRGHEQPGIRMDFFILNFQLKISRVLKSMVFEKGLKMFSTVKRMLMTVSQVEFRTHNYDRLAIKLLSTTKHPTSKNTKYSCKQLYILLIDQ